MLVLAAVGPGQQDDVGWKSAAETQIPKDLSLLDVCDSSYRLRLGQSIRSIVGFPRLTVDVPQCRSNPPRQCRTPTSRSAKSENDRNYEQWKYDRW